MANDRLRQVCTLVFAVGQVVTPAGGGHDAEVAETGTVSPLARNPLRG
ncbi:MAG TPA: hypothetical protein VK358_06940 [Longimicrobium sp.]|nr:hypothetical protein [Longimicrobium sp.]